MEFPKWNFLDGTIRGRVRLSLVPPPSCELKCASESWISREIIIILADDVEAM